MFFRFSDGFGATWGGERTEDDARAEARREAARASVRERCSCGVERIWIQRATDGEIVVVADTGRRSAK